MTAANPPIKVGVVGGTGYTGVELLRLLAAHPSVRLAVITSRGDAGTPVANMFPNLRGRVDLAFTAPDPAKVTGADRKAAITAFQGELKTALTTAGYPSKADPAAINKPLVVAILTWLVLLVTMVYGPIAAMLVELFPTKIRYTSMSLPYHIGNGWFGGFLPTTAFAMVAATGDIYYGLWYPIVVAGLTLVVGLLFLPETFRKNIDE